MGQIVARVARRLDVGFALKFIEPQAVEALEHLIRQPTGPVAQRKPIVTDFAKIRAIAAMQR